MPTAPMMTPGLVSLTPGAQAGAADMTGLGGLFGALMGYAGSPVNGMQTLGDGLSGMRFGMAGDAMPTEGAADMMAAMTQGGFDMQAFLASQGLTEQVVQLDEKGGEITVQGEAATVQAFVVEVKEIYQRVVVEGGLTLGEARSSTALAGALEKLGMDPETAMNVAERIETMLKLVEQYQAREKGLDDATAGTLVAMMLAVMGQAVNARAAGDEGGAAAFRLQITTVEQTVTVTSRTITALRSSGDVARDLLAGEGALATPAPEPTTMQALEVSVTRDGETARIGMVLPEAEAVPAPVVAQDGGVDTAQDIAVVAARAPVTVQPLKPEAVIQAPEGEVYYTLKADEDGVEMVEAVKPLPREALGAEGSVESLRTQAEAPAATKAVASGDTGTSQPVTRTESTAAPAEATRSYAAEIEALNSMLDKAQVAKQVAVQMMPLLEQGGGSVRLQLNPVELGRITIELNVRDGQVEGAIAASEPRVMEHLARELHSLRQGLAEAGLKVSEQGISLMLSNQNSGGQFGQNGGHHAQQAQDGGRGSVSSSGPAAGATAEAVTDTLAPSLSAWVSPERVLDVNV